MVCSVKSKYGDCFPLLLNQQFALNSKAKAILASLFVLFCFLFLGVKFTVFPRVAP